MEKERLKETITLCILFSVYLLCSVRYFPGDLAATITATAKHLGLISPFTIGGTVVVVTVLKRLNNYQLNGSVVLRLFFTISIVIEFFFGLYNYLAVNQGIPPA